MIPVTEISNIFKTLAVYLSCPIYRANQTKETESVHPHGIYNILSDQNEHAYQNVINRTANADLTRVNNDTYEKSKLVISLMFADKNRIDRIAVLSRNAMRWFKTIVGQEYCKAQGGIVVSMINNNVQDRTIWVEHLAWENRYGFDLQFQYVYKLVDTIERIAIVEVMPSPEGIDQAEITIPV